MKKYREKNNNIANAAIVGAVSEESVLYASANKEYLAILDDKTLGRTLKGISKYKVNPKSINIKILTNKRAFLRNSKSKPMPMLKISLWKMGRGWCNMTIFLWIKRLRLESVSQTMPRLIKTMNSLIMSGWIETGMSFLTRSRRVNLWAEMVRSVLKNSYLKIMRNI